MGRGDFASPNAWHAATVDLPGGPKQEGPRRLGVPWTFFDGIFNFRLGQYLPPRLEKLRSLFCNGKDGSNPSKEDLIAYW